MADTYDLWPERLPQKPVTLKGENVIFGIPENTAVSNDPDVGPPLSRPRSTSYYRPVFIPLIVQSDYEAQIFYEFYMYTLGNGTQPFIWDDWVRHGSPIFQFDLSEQRPDPEGIGHGFYKLPLRLLQHPEGTSRERPVKYYF